MVLPLHRIILWKMGIEIGWHFKMSISNLAWWDNSVNGMIQCLSLSIYQALLLHGQLIFFFNRMCYYF